MSPEKLIENAIRKFPFEQFGQPGWERELASEIVKEMLLTQLSMERPQVEGDDLIMETSLDDEGFKTVVVEHRPTGIRVKARHDGSWLETKSKALEELYRELASR